MESQAKAKSATHEILHRIFRLKIDLSFKDGIELTLGLGIYWKIYIFVKCLHGLFYLIHDLKWLINYLF